MTYLILKYYQEIETEDLEPLLIRKTIPICMWQYERTFKTTRYLFISVSTCWMNLQFCDGPLKCVPVSTSYRNQSCMLWLTILRLSIYNIHVHSWYYMFNWHVIFETFSKLHLHLHNYPMCTKLYKVVQRLSYIKEVSLFLPL